MFYIQVPDMNDSVSTLIIDGTMYRIRFTYNEKYDYWSFGLYKADGSPLVAMTRIVPNFSLFFYYSGVDFPDGHFGCISKKETVGRYAFVNGDAEFVYLPNSELNTITAR